MTTQEVDVIHKRSEILLWEACLVLFNTSFTSLMKSSAILISCLSVSKPIKNSINLKLTTKLKDVSLSQTTMFIKKIWISTRLVNVIKDWHEILIFWLCLANVQDFGSWWSVSSYLKQYLNSYPSFKYLNNQNEVNMRITRNLENRLKTISLLRTLTWWHFKGDLGLSKHCSCSLFLSPK